MTEYFDEILSYLKEKESLEKRINHEYLNNQIDFNRKMRATIIDWLIEVHEHFK